MSSHPSRYSSNHLHSSSLYCPQCSILRSKVRFNDRVSVSLSSRSPLIHQMSMMGSSVDVIAWEQPSDDMTHCSVSANSPSMAAANNIVQASQQGYPWGFVSSPIESSFSSELSTPLFASPISTLRLPLRASSASNGPSQCLRRIPVRAPFEVRGIAPIWLSALDLLHVLNGLPVTHSGPSWIHKFVISSKKPDCRLVFAYAPASKVWAILCRDLRCWSDTSSRSMTSCCGIVLVANPISCGDATHQSFDREFNLPSNRYDRRS
jgi:hypothetical protein